MSPRYLGAGRPDGRGVRDRLQSSLGGKGLLVAEGSGEPFEYDGGGSHAGDRDASGTVECVTGKTGPALRWRTGFRAALLVGALAVMGGACFWWQVAAERPQVVPLSDVAQHSGPASGAAETGVPEEAEDPDPEGQSAGSTQPDLVVVHVAGAVGVPGLVQLPAGSRVHQAIAAAGGGNSAADVNRMNLAAVLTDGQKLYVPEAGEQAPAGQSTGVGVPAGDGGSSVGAKVNLNTAGVDELDALPKVGPVLAQRIVDWRKEHGLFKSVEELDAVDGVGPKMLETLLPLVGV